MNSSAIADAVVMIVVAIVGFLIGMAVMNRAMSQDSIIEADTGTPIELTDDWEDFQYERQGQDGKEWDEGTQRSWDEGDGLKYIRQGCEEFCGNDKD